MTKPKITCAVLKAIRYVLWRLVAMALCRRAYPSHSHNDRLNASTERGGYTVFDLFCSCYIFKPNGQVLGE